MIKAVVVVNNHGKPRLCKFYQPFVSFLKIIVIVIKNDKSSISKILINNLYRMKQLNKVLSQRFSNKFQKDQTVFATFWKEKRLIFFYKLKLLISKIKNKKLIDN